MEYREETAGCIATIARLCQQFHEGLTKPGYCSKTPRHVEIQEAQNRKIRTISLILQSPKIPVQTLRQMFTFASMNYVLKKSLGQHFLKDEHICRKIVETLQEKPFRQLLEVGPGGGALTKYLIGIGDIDFKAVEVDDEKVNFLLKTYPVLRDKIIHKDFLAIEQPFEGKFTVVGNFPYNISSQILFKMLDWKDNVACMIGMFQKEVALRVVAKEGSKVYGVTSVLVQAFFSVDYLFEVSEQSFTPPPKVKSAVIRLTPKSERVAMKSERALFVLVKTAFNQRRKTLRNAVKSLFDATIVQEDIFNKRAEQLSVEDFARLTFKMQ